jgi:hypothetical protein
MTVLLGVASCSGVPRRPIVPKPVNCPDGTTRVERVFRNEQATPEIVGINESCERSDGTLHGPTADWHTSEEIEYSGLRLVYQGQYDDGQEVGVWRAWHPNGEKKSENHYLREFEIVAHLFWYPNGRPRAAYQYWQRKRHGSEIYWEESGELDSVRVFDRGRLVHPANPDPGMHRHSH